MIDARPWLALFVCLACGIAPPGCSRPPATEENRAALHLRKIGQAYDLAILKTRRPPRSADELMPFLQQLVKQADAEEFIRSPNDGQPFEIVWQVNLDNPADLSALLAYEKVGVKGRRYVMTVSRIVKEISEDEFRKAPLARGGKPAKDK